MTPSQTARQQDIPPARPPELVGEDEHYTSPIPESGVDASGKRIVRSPEEIARRNARAIAALKELSEIGDEADHRETMAILRHALGEGRIISNRKLF